MMVNAVEVTGNTPCSPPDLGVVAMNNLIWRSSNRSLGEELNTALDNSFREQVVKIRPVGGNHAQQSSTVVCLAKFCAAVFIDVQNRVAVAAPGEFKVCKGLCSRVGRDRTTWRDLCYLIDQVGDAEHKFCEEKSITNRLLRFLKLKHGDKYEYNPVQMTLSRAGFLAKSLPQDATPLTKPPADVGSPRTTPKDPNKQPLKRPMEDPTEGSLPPAKKTCQTTAPFNGKVAEKPRTPLASSSSSSAPKTAKTADKPTVTPKTTNTAMADTAIADKPAVTPKTTKTADKSAATPKTANAADKLASSPKTVNKANKPPGTPKTANTADKPLGTPKTANTADKPLGTPKAANMANKPAKAPKDNQASGYTDLRSEIVKMLAFGETNDPKNPTADGKSSGDNDLRQEIAKMLAFGETWTKMVAKIQANTTPAPSENEELISTKQKLAEMIVENEKMRIRMAEVDKTNNDLLIDARSMHNYLTKTKADWEVDKVKNKEYIADNDKQFKDLLEVAKEAQQSEEHHKTLLAEAQVKAVEIGAKLAGANEELAEATNRREKDAKMFKATIEELREEMKALEDDAKTSTATIEELREDKKTLEDDLITVQEDITTLQDDAKKLQVELERERTKRRGLETPAKGTPTKGTPIKSKKQDKLGKLIGKGSRMVK